MFKTGMTTGDFWRVVNRNCAQLAKAQSLIQMAGFNISIDDFGTGYSSLSLLADMPVDTLKIDKSFVDRLESKPEDSKDVTLVRHIIMMAKDLRFHCLAEGAESKAQVDRLRSLGCETIQGYYYSKPIPVCEYEKLL